MIYTLLGTGHLKKKPGYMANQISCLYANVKNILRMTKLRYKNTVRNALNTEKCMFINQQNSSTLQHVISRIITVNLHQATAHQDTTQMNQGHSKCRIFVTFLYNNW